MFEDSEIDWTVILVLIVVVVVAIVVMMSMRKASAKKVIAARGENVEEGMVDLPDNYVYGAEEFGDDFDGNVYDGGFENQLPPPPPPPPPQPRQQHKIVPQEN